MNPENIVVLVAIESFWEKMPAIGCTYETTSPIGIIAVAPGERNVFAYNASCDGAADVLMVQGVPVVDYVMVNGNNTLAFCACKSAPDGATEPCYLSAES